MLRARSDRQRTLKAFSNKSGREIWSVTVEAAYENREIVEYPRDRPLIADLDEDGRAEILVPESGSITPGRTYAGVRLIEGRTGGTDGGRPDGTANIDEDGLAEAVIAPDLDGDGGRGGHRVGVQGGESSGDLCRRTFGKGRAHSLVVESRLAEDVRPNRDARLVGTRSRRLAAPCACPSGGRAETRKHWYVGPHFHEGLSLEPNVHMLEASSGRERYTVIGLEHPRVADLDGDGLTDLWGEDRRRACGERFCGEAARRRWQAAGPDSWRPACPPALATASTTRTANGGLRRRRSCRYGHRPRGKTGQPVATAGLGNAGSPGHRRWLDQGGTGT